MLDKTGTLIPQHLEAVFKRPGLLMIMEKYQTLYDSVMEKINDGDELFVGISTPTFSAIHSDIQRNLMAQHPYAVCSWCEGEGCRNCKDKGFIGKFAYELTPQKGAE
jgi:hypothetical protein